MSNTTRFLALGMFWGKRTSRTALGRVAEYCPICRKNRTCELLEVRRSARVLIFPFGPATLEGHETRCETCDTCVPTDKAKYAAISRESQADVEALLRETNPRLDVPPVSARRKDLLREPFRVLEPLVREKAEEGSYGPISQILLVLLVLGYMQVEEFTAGTNLWAIPILVFLAVATYVMTIAERGFMRKWIEPRLVRALGSLRPTPRELMDTVARLRKHGYLVARRTHVGRLARLLEQADPAHLTPA